MATRDEVAELRALVERRNATARWLGRTASAAVLVLCSLKPVHF